MKGKSITATVKSLKNEPEKYLTIIIDGMDQAKTNIPQPVQESKSTNNLWRIRTHITGTIKSL